MLLDSAIFIVTSEKISHVGCATTSERCIEQLKIPVGRGFVCGLIRALVWACLAYGSEAANMTGQGIESGRATNVVRKRPLMMFVLVVRNDTQLA